MIKIKEAKEIIDSWINGNRTEVKNIMKNKTKCFALDLVIILVGQYGFKYHNAIYEVYEMCESDKDEK